jgi:hypothetical protein
MCGWRGRSRNGDGRCIDTAACAHRASLNAKGRPRESACACVIWPCPCVCHHFHTPEIWLTELEDEPPTGR